MSRVSRRSYEEDFDYEEEDDEIGSGKRPYKKEKYQEKKRSWERESIPDYDDYERR